jgi:energy-converting hydrogenase A subunit D
MTDIFFVLATLLTLIGSIATLVIKNPFDKLITLGILVSGTIIFMILRGYLDVAIVVSLMMPVGTFFILLLCRKKPEGLQ